MSASGKWIQGNIAYLYKKQWERENKRPFFNESNKNFDFGHEAEPLAVAWLREHKIDLGIVGAIKHCSCEEDFPDDILFVKTDFGLGGSPDIVIERNSEFVTGVEIKSVKSPEKWARLASDTLPYETKRAEVFKEHRDQLSGHMLTFPNWEEVYLLKYRPPIDEDPFDTDNPLARWRGILFVYKREEFGSYLEEVENRVRFANEYLDSGEDLELLGKIK